MVDKTSTSYPSDTSTKVNQEDNGGLSMKWLIFIALTQGNSFTIDDRPFETEDDCIAYISSIDNVDHLAVEVISRAGFNARLTELRCITEQERKTYETIQKL